MKYAMYMTVVGNKVFDLLNGEQSLTTKNLSKNVFNRTYLSRFDAIVYKPALPPPTLHMEIDKKI